MLRLQRFLKVRGITLDECAGALGIANKTLRNKLSGVTEFTYSETLKLRILRSITLTTF